MNSGPAVGECGHGEGPGAGVVRGSASQTGRRCWAPKWWSSSAVGRNSRERGEAWQRGPQRPKGRSEVKLSRLRKGFCVASLPVEAEAPRLIDGPLPHCLVEPSTIPTRGAHSLSEPGPYARALNPSNLCVPGPLERSSFVAASPTSTTTCVPAALGLSRRLPCLGLPLCGMTFSPVLDHLNPIFRHFGTPFVHYLGLSEGPWGACGPCPCPFSCVASRQSQVQTARCRSQARPQRPGACFVLA